MGESQFAWSRGALLLPLLLVISFLYVLPFFGVARWSFTLPELGIGNYQQAVTNLAVLSVLWRTLKVCLIVTVCSVMIAYLLSYHWVYGAPAWQRVIELAVLVTLWTSVLVRALGWLIVLRSNGVINNFLLDLGLISRPLRLGRNELAVIIAMTHFMVPYAMFPLITVMRKVDQRILMASRGLGAGRLRTFWSVFIPLTTTGTIGSFVIVFVFTLGFFITPAIVGGGRVVMAAEYILLQMFQTVNWGLGSALSVLLLVFVCVLVWVVFKVTRVNRLVT